MFMIVEFIVRGIDDVLGKYDCVKFLIFGNGSDC